jgi:hypothetical protein
MIKFTFDIDLKSSKKLAVISAYAVIPAKAGISSEIAYFPRGYLHAQV